MFEQIQKNIRLIVAIPIAIIICLVVSLSLTNTTKQQDTRFLDENSKKIESIDSQYSINEEHVRLTLDYLRIENKNQEIRLNLLEQKVKDLQEVLKNNKKK